MRGLVVVGFVVLTALARPACAQSAEPSLAEIARKAEAAKGSTPKATKTYTNADLARAGAPPAPEPAVPPSSGFMSESLGKPVSAEEMLKLSEAKSAAEEKALTTPPEEYWVGQAETIRKQVATMAPRLARLRARPKNANPELQKRSDQEAAMLNGQIDALRARWIKLEVAARGSKVNMSWLSPPPAFPE